MCFVTPEAVRLVYVLIYRHRQLVSIPCNSRDGPHHVTQSQVILIGILPFLITAYSENEALRFKNQINVHLNFLKEDLRARPFVQSPGEYTASDTVKRYCVKAIESESMGWDLVTPETPS